MKRDFSRRNLLSGLGASAAFLPLLHTTTGFGAAQAFPRRLVVVVWPNGVMPEQFWPIGSNTDFAPPADEYAPLLPMMAHRDDLIVLGGLEVRNLIDNGAGAGHAALPFLLTGVPGAQFDGEISDGVDKTAGGPSVDQFIADEIAKSETLPFHSLVLRANRFSGDDVFASFRGPPAGGRPNAPTPQDDPVQLFDALFSGGTMDDPELARIRAERRSVLDYVGSNLEDLGSRLGTEDREKIQAHIAAVREIELQLDQDDTGCLAPERPDPAVDYVSEPANRNLPATLKIQTDMVVAALACDMTRVASLLWSNSNNNSFTFFWLGDEFAQPPPYDEVAGFDGGYRHHHEISHNAHRGDYDRRLKNMVDHWFHQQFAYFIERLKSVPEGDGTMLDNTAILFANCMAVGASHSVSDLPWILAGSCGGYFRTGRYIRWAGGSEGSHIPQNALLTELCRAMGLELDGFGAEQYWADLAAVRA